MDEAVTAIGLLRRTGFPVPAEILLEPNERATLIRYGYWLEALADGRLSAATPEQEQFVGVARGERLPRTVFEAAWMKYQRAVAPRPVPGPDEIRQRLAQLASARTANASIEAAYRERQSAVLAKVRKELLALRDEFGPQLVNARLHIADLEAILREAVLATGESVRRDGVSVVYSRGRVTWDGKGLAAFCESNPEVEQFRRVGKPTVSIRYSDGNSPAELDTG